MAARRGLLSREIGTWQGYPSYLMKGCPLYRDDTLSSLTIVIVNDATENSAAANRSGTRWGCRAGKGDLLFEALMGPGGVMVGDKLRHHPPEMCLIDNQNLVQTLLAHRPHPAFGIGIGIRGLVRGADHL